MKYFMIALLLCLTVMGFADQARDSENVTTDSTTYQLAKTLSLLDVDRVSLIVHNYGDGDCDATYEFRMYPDDSVSDYIYEGTATSAGATLIDTNATFAVNVIGQTVHNVVDKSYGTITDTTSTSIYATLANGTNNAWAVGDYYKITRPQKYYSVGSVSLAADEQAVYELTNYYSRMDLMIKKTAASDSTATLKFSYNLKISQ